MNIGKLYKVNKFFWYLYPTKDIAIALTDARTNPGVPGSVDVATCVDAVDTKVAYFSGRFNCNVSYIPENSIFCLLKQDGNILKVLSTNGEMGWIKYPEWAKGWIEEVAQE